MGRIQQSGKSLSDLVRLELLDEIRRGKYLVNSRLPNEEQLAKEMGVSRNTLREALRVLEASGVVEKKQGLGTFILGEPSPKAKPGLEVLFRVTDAILEMGSTPGTSEAAFEMSTADARVAEKLGIEVGTSVYHLRRVRTADGIPVVYCIDTFPAVIGELEVEKMRSSVFAYLEEVKGVRISYASTDLRPIVAGKELADKLSVSAASPLLLLDEVHFDKLDQPIFYSRLFFRSDYFVFHLLRSH
ncbi:transcriptional regulator [Desulfosporosinus acidiphilus SJ4]|uniref:Transcriptional regulator n=1 Tax=Desulfosporosinus acidiphilus (strain DSM 22704 / JCM 16185 / SJ4) TaxID=646529 RepID=I4D8C6_DESAJ|nr:GntR family transcriptional regulator [Desulfosporosinus acidiphilus]AFM42050.1 transcriptional regulator [Desulfosporosinus acidiphilus SJ4]